MGAGKSTPAAPIKPGDKIPAIKMDCGFNPIVDVDMADRCKDKKVPGYLAKQAELKAKGVDEVFVYCVNDGAVMKGWAKDQGVEGSMITFLGDTRGEFSAAVGMLMNHPGPNHALGKGRCKRFVIVADKGTVTHVELSEGKDDPAGDADPKGPVTAKTLAEHILTLL